MHRSDRRYSALRSQDPRRRVDGMLGILLAAYIFHTVMRLGIQSARVGVCVVVAVVGTLRREGVQGGPMRHAVATMCGTLGP
jgi:hypothetical protein